ncbi:hypothetical protein [Intestinibacter sp.]|uniref:hypothetical protein n=1 Tax=Intestinibacter sp. TaxID=1965304 RepID=UPI002A75FE2A|nr:hypothetical protein [Intestinibacter sp.]MDY2737539.1 hypothetical protein [Intestinibacter sp.]
MSRYSKSDYFNHEGYRDITAYKALKNIKRRRKTMLKFRITFRRDKKEELDKAIEQLKKSFTILNISDVYENTRNNSMYARVYVDVECK